MRTARWPEMGKRKHSASTVASSRRITAAGACALVCESILSKYRKRAINYRPDLSPHRDGRMRAASGEVSRYWFIIECLLDMNSFFHPPPRCPRRRIRIHGIKYIINCILYCRIVSDVLRIVPITAAPKRVISAATPSTSSIIFLLIILSQY